MKVVSHIALRKIPTAPMTHEFLGQMLGVRRASISVAAAVLQKAGIIQYNRGKMRVIDRPQMENIACECYGIIKNEYDRLLEQ
jgi:DNA-binding transcriptional regulator YhcF (GntR family)